MEEKDYEHFIDAEDIPALIRGILSLFDKDEWNKFNESIWTFEEIRESLITDICNLMLLKKYMETHPNIKVYFYDSY